MIDAPTAAELVAAIAGWLDAPEQGAPAFERRVARNALNIVARELALRPEAEARAHERLRAITGADGSVATLEGMLCDAIRDRRLAATDPALLAHLKATALDRLAIDQPHYRHDLGETR